MGNSSSSKKQQKHEQIKKLQKKQTFCCFCSTKSSSSLSLSNDSYLPTFDRIVEKKISFHNNNNNNNNNQNSYSNYYVDLTQSTKNTNDIVQTLTVEIPKQEQSISENSSIICTPTLSSVSNTKKVKDDNNSLLTTSSTSSSHNRRSLSLDNVVVTPTLNRHTDNSDGDGVFKIPQLPLRQLPSVVTPSATITQSRSHHFSSFRLPLTNTKRTYYSQSIEQAKSSIEDLEKSLQGCQSIDKWIDSLSILGTPSLSRINKHRIITTPVSQQRQKKRTSTTVDDELFINYQKPTINEIVFNKQCESPVINDFDEDLPTLLVSNTTSNLEVLHLAKCLNLNLLTLNNYLKDFLFRLLYYQQTLYKQRLKLLPLSCNNKKTIKNHFSHPVMIYPVIDNNSTQISTILANDLYIEFIYPLECILPTLLTSPYSTYNIQEQIRSRCFFIPEICFKTLPLDDDYKHKQEIEQTTLTHVVIDLEMGNKDTSNQIKKLQQTDDSSLCLFICDENEHSTFYTGHIRLDKSYLKQYTHFVYRLSNEQEGEDNNYYLSSYVFRQWFQSLIILNQTCSIANRFLTGDGSYLTCLLKPEKTMTKIDLIDNNEIIMNNSNSSSLSNHVLKRESSIEQNLSTMDDQYHIQLVCLRLPPTLYLLDSSSTDQNDHINNNKETNELRTKLSHIHAFSDLFLSNNKNSETCINVDYEQYVFAIPLIKWPTYILNNYYYKRNLKRKWPSKYHMNIIIKKQILVIPKSNCKMNLSQSTNHHLDDRWQLNFDLVENLLYEYMNESTLFLFTFCLQLFSLTKKLNGINHSVDYENEQQQQNDEYAIRLCIKHCFLNYCEKYGLPFSTSISSRQSTNDSILDLTHHFLKELYANLKQNFLSHYFNHEYNILNIFFDNDNSNVFLKWFNHIEYCSLDRQKWFTLKLQYSNSTMSVYKPLVIEYMFYYIDQLYDEFHIKRKDMRFNEQVLIELHEKLCEKLTNENGLIWTNDIMNNQTIRMKIQYQLANEFEKNAELIHTCLNQIRRAESSLIFHYTWTLYLQYLHSYFNCIWNLFQ